MAPIPVPHDGGIPSVPMFANGYYELVVLITAAALLTAFGMMVMMLWALRNVTRRRERISCPVRLRPARVMFRVAPDGKRTDVLRCSVFGRRPITCGKACLRPVAAG
jgi:hypothetical protein